MTESKKRERVLYTWIGKSDIKAAEKSNPEIGPIAKAVDERLYSRIYLLADDARRDSSYQDYREWLIKRYRGDRESIKLMSLDFENPTNFDDVLCHAIEVLEETEKNHKNPELVFHLSPGTPVMAAVWILLAKTRYPATLIQADRHKKQVEEASLSFEFDPTYVDYVLRFQDQRLETLFKKKDKNLITFDQILGESEIMKKIKDKARRMARLNQAVLILGETGTGKELYARAIHNHGYADKPVSIKEKPFVAVNCAAIPETLFESEFFGYVEGAFSGAKKPKKGLIEQAKGGTLFLDEIGELPKLMQAKLLRVLEDKTVRPLGAEQEKKVMFRLIAATNRNLVEAIKKGTFRGDLFFRIAVGVLELPLLSERENDIQLLADRLLEEINTNIKKQDNAYQSRILSEGALKVIRDYQWPGNVRELKLTLSRAAIWSKSDIITGEELEGQFIFPDGLSEDESIESSMDRLFEKIPKVDDALLDLEKHYIRRAIEKTKGNKTEAAKLLGRNYQKINYRRKKLKMVEAKSTGE